MSYAPSPVRLPASIPMVDDGEAPDAASVAVTMEGLADGIKALDNKIYAAEILTRFQWRFSGGFNAAQGFNADTGLTAPGTPGISCSSGYYFSLELDLAHGAELNQVRCYVWSDGSARKVEVWKMDLINPVDAGGDIDYHPAETSLASSTTKTTINANYGYVSVTIPGTEIVDRSRYRYYAVVSGTAAGSGTWWFGCRVLTEGLELDKGAG